MAAERLADRVLVHARSVAGRHAARRREALPPPQNMPAESGIDKLISRVLAHATTVAQGRGQSRASVDGARSSMISTVQATEMGNEMQSGQSGQSASLLSSTFLSSLDVSGGGGDAAPVSPIPFRPELNSSQETILDQRVKMKDAETQFEGPFAGIGQLADSRPADDPSSLSFLQSDESKEPEETRLPEDVKPRDLDPVQATVPATSSVDPGDHGRQVQEMELTLTDLKKKLAEETKEKEQLNGALAEALAALAESERATESARPQLSEASKIEQNTQESDTTLQVSQSETSLGGQGLHCSHLSGLSAAGSSSRKPSGLEAEQVLEGALVQESDTTLQVSQSETSLGGQGAESSPQRSSEFQAEPNLQHALVQVADADSTSQLRELEGRLEETQRQLEACLQAAAQPAEDRASIGIGGLQSYSMEEASPNPYDDKLMACLDLRYCLGDLLDPPELLLKAAMGQLYAVLCLQTKAKSFLATKHLEEVRHTRPRRARPTSAMYQASRVPVHRQSLPQVFTHGLHVSGFHEIDDEASTERRRWSDAPAVPPLALSQLGPGLGEVKGGKPPCERALDEVQVVARGSAVSAVRAESAAKARGQGRPSSSPGLFTQKRSDPPVKPLRRAMSAGGAAAARSRATSASRSRPQSHSRKGRSCGNPEGFVPQAELWLIKNRALASMMWPPLSEAARGQRPKTKTACVRCLPDSAPRAQGTSVAH